jgi:hypothetical protein
MPRWSALLALVFTLAIAPTALADVQVASSGATTATFSFERGEDYGYSDLRLQVQRAGVLVYDAPVRAEGCEEPSCAPGAYDRDSVAVADLTGDGEPEVIVTLYWGGAHCCTIGVILSFDGTAYRVSEYNFGDPGYTVTDLEGDGRSEFLTRDARFAYRYAAYAFSIFPVQVLSWDGTKVVDTTNAHKDLVREDVKRSWKLFVRAKYEPRGAAAAWAANRYRLGERRSTLRTLRRLARAGRLKGYSPRSASKFVASLDRFLVRGGFLP